MSEASEEHKKVSDEDIEEAEIYKTEANEFFKSKCILIYHI